MAKLIIGIHEMSYAWDNCICHNCIHLFVLRDKNIATFLEPAVGLVYNQCDEGKLYAWEFHW